MNTSNHIESFEFELDRKGYRSESIKNYVSCVTKFLYRFKEKDSVKHISEDDIKHFLYQFKTHNTQRGYHSAIKAFYKYVANQPNKFKWIEYCRRENKLPIVLSVEEMQRIIFAATNLKHKTIICLMYSTGMRVGEVINLRICDIDSSRMVINILDAKGGKDRQVTLDPTMLDLLRVYFKQYHPKDFLFNGQFEAYYSTRSIAQFLQKYANIIQRLLGHSSIKTTQGYSHISNNLISKVRTPLQFILNNNSQQLLKTA